MHAAKPGDCNEDTENHPIQKLPTPSPAAGNQPCTPDRTRAACLPLQPAANGWPNFGPDSAKGVGPTALKWAAQHRHCSEMSHISFAILQHFLNQISNGYLLLIARLVTMYSKSVSVQRYLETEQTMPKHQNQRPAIHSACKTCLIQGISCKFCSQN